MDDAKSPSGPADQDPTGEPVSQALEELQDIGVIWKEERPIIRDLAAMTAEKRKEARPQSDALIEAVTSGEMRWETEFLPRLREIGSYETDVGFAAPQKEVSGLLRRGILIETPSGGQKFSEPFWPFMYRLLDNPAKTAEARATSSAALSLVGRAVRWVCAKIGAHRTLETRYWLAHSVVASVGQEPSILFSRTPAVFNPEEHLNPKNYTQRFMEALLGATHKTVYVWNREAVVEQIRTQLRSKAASERDSSRTAESLREEYVRHFSRYAANGFLEFWWGDNSAMTSSTRSLQYVSERRVVVGARDLGGKLDCGVDMDRGRLRALFLAVGAAAMETLAPCSSLALILFGPALADKVLGPSNYNACYQQLVTNTNLERLSGTHPKEIVHYAFERALSKPLSA